MKKNFCYLYVFILLFVSFMLISLLFLKKTFILEWNLIELNGVTLTFPVLLDMKSMIFGLSVSLISMSVIIFSLSYMFYEKFFLRFHYLVTLFVFSMYLLIFSPNFVSIILGWDGLGVTSYLLVIYFNSSKAFNAAKITAFTNRIGDCLILISMGLMWSKFSFNHFIISEYMSNFKLPLVLVFCIMMAASTKSAQIPFSAWLPAAMAAPTPVSSLVHSSTLVTAGIYLLIRFGSFLDLNSSKFVFILGLITMIMAGMSAFFEIDMKKIVALSTLSQLGLMMMTIGLNSPEITLFHLLSHAFFKALLFMCMGNFIHLNKGDQDLRKSHLPVNSLSFGFKFSMIANFSLMGMPFFSGFYSKDSAIELSCVSSLSVMEFFIVFLSIFITGAYTIRLVLLLTCGSNMNSMVSMTADKDSIMMKGKLILWPLAIMAGSMISWVMFSSPLMLIMPNSMKNFILFMIIFSIFLSWVLFQPWDYFLKKNYFMNWTLGSMWSLPFISGRMNKKTYSTGQNYYFELDSGWTLKLLMIMIFCFNKMNIKEKQMYFFLEMIYFSFLISFLLFM